jgi:hypothetical protein
MNNILETSKNLFQNFNNYIENKTKMRTLHLLAITILAVTALVTIGNLASSATSASWSFINLTGTVIFTHLITAFPVYYLCNRFSYKLEFPRLIRTLDKIDATISDLFGIRTASEIEKSCSYEKRPTVAEKIKFSVIDFFKNKFKSILCTLIGDGAGYMATSIIGLPCIYALPGLGAPILGIRIVVLFFSTILHLKQSYERGNETPL